MKQLTLICQICCGLLLVLLWPACMASQQEIDTILQRVDAGFRQTFDGKSLRRWQETYQSACAQDVPRLARLLQEEGTDLRFDPYGQHRDLLRKTLPGMQDKQMQAMDLHVQLSQQWMALPPTSQQAINLRTQMSNQEKTVKLYDSIVTTLRERLTYLDKCARFADQQFAAAAQAKQSTRPSRPPVVSTRPATGGSVAMPTGISQPIEYDPKKGISIGQIGELEPSLTTHSVPPTVAATSGIPPKPGSADVNAALQQAAQKCKDAYQRAYDQLLRNKRKTVADSKNEIPKLEACIREKRAELANWQQRRNETLQELGANREHLRNLQQELAIWRDKTENMAKQAGKFGAADKWKSYDAEEQRVAQEISNEENGQRALQRKLTLIDETIAAIRLQMVDCEVRLQLFREKIAAAEKALNDSILRTIEAHRQKRWAEIERLLANHNLPALERCAQQGYVDLNDLLRNLE